MIGFEPHLDAAFAALRQGRPKDADAAFSAALPILSTATTENATFLGIVTMQCALGALGAGDEPLARAYAALVLAQTARELERQGTLHRDEAERIEREGHGAPDGAQLERVRAVLADMYTYAVAFVPFVRGQTPVALSEALPDRTPDQLAAVKLVLENVRPRLDAAGWSTWDYAAAAARTATFWSAYCFTHLGQLRLDNASAGRDVEDADRLADGALALIPNDSRDRLHADALGLKGRVLARYGLMQIDEAIAHTEASLHIVDALPDPVAAAGDRTNLGAMYQMKAEAARANGDDRAAGLLADAERYLLQARDAYRQDDPYGRIAGVLVNLGVVYTDGEKWDDALNAFLEADAALPQARYNFETRAKIALNIGELYNERRRFVDAVPWFAKALAAKPADGTVTLDPEVEIMARGGLGVATLRSVGPAQAEPHLLSAMDLIETYRRSYFSERTNASLLARYRWVHEAYIDLCATLGATDAAYRTRAFETAEKLKWRTITTVLRYRSLGFVDEREEPSIAEERTLLAFLSTRLLGDPSAVRRDVDVATAMRRLEAIWNDLAARHPDYVAIRREETIDAASAFALFDDHVSALVEFYLGDQYGTALAFVLVRGETAPRVVRLTVDAERIAQLVAAVRARTTDVPIAAFRAASKELYDATIAPLIDLIPDGVGICIVPYGQLHNAPFSGLWDGARYLFERNALTIAASVSALRWWLRKDRGARERCLVFAATSNIREGGKQLVNLDSFADLARRVVAPLFPQAIVVAGADATKQRLLDALVPSDATGPDVAHLACHGIAKPEGFASCLVLAGDDASDAKDLSALEIASGLRIDASLVTLSACHSAVSETSTGGDEVAGLAQAFLMAGASSVLATLWEVRQDAGDSVMCEFYERWCAKTGPCESKIASLQAALRIASQSPNALGRLGGLLGLHDDVSHPYLWSTLQLYGNWR